MKVVYRSPSIPSPLRDHAPHPAPGILHITGVPRDEVDVQVHHRLSGGRAHVHADVVAVGVVETVIEQPFCLSAERQQCGLLLVRRLEEAGDVPEGDKQQVAGVHRIFVVVGVAEIVCEHDLLRWRITERAGHIAHAAYPLTPIK